MTSSPLQADLLARDPRVRQARELLLSALRDHRQQLTGLREADASRVADYAREIEEFAELRGGSLFYPYLGSGIGHGALVELADGSVKYDMITGIGVHGFGHSDPEFAAAAFDAALGDTIMQGNLQQNRESEALCRDLIGLARDGGSALSHCFLTTSGATANENAFKLLFQKRAPADRMLAFANCFAGRTLAMSQVTDRPKNREGLPPFGAVDYVPFFDATAPEESGRVAVGRLREHLQRYPGRHAGMILELIQGEGGYYTAPRDFFVAILSQLREHQIPIFFDEIQTFGRTTRPFAFQHLGLDDFADVVTVGKITQICATLFRSELKPKAGLISQTFTGATASILAARSLLERLQSGGYFGDDGRIMQLHRRFVEHFERIQQQWPNRFAGPWGLGGMLAFTVYGGAAEATRKFMNQLYQAGVMTFSAGADPTRVRLLPPLGVISDQEIDEVCDILEKTIRAGL
ncbi:aminotransferase class III-fold pyridoxal phosphate-dependent enzyme [Planctomicrobium sp. SH664]|uniref:aminotransferase class III-fold pyridoxal phosphate-dependent enzyme n=1 Tax=Planctomicrobium sp. SH664 TaxID=3448125 RepID=UPI003F5BAD79